MDRKAIGVLGIIFMVVLSVVCLLPMTVMGQASDIANNTAEMVDSLWALWPLIVFIIVISIVLGLLKKFTTLFG